MRFILCLLILFSLLLSPSVVYSEKKSGNSLFQYSVDLAPFEKNEKKKYHLEVVQPYSFIPESVKKSMAFLIYQQKGIGWSKEKKIFSLSMIKRLAPLIVRRFTEAGPEQRIVFKITDPGWKTFLEGDTFLTIEGLNWRFTTVNRVSRKIDDFSIMGDKWRMLPRKGQTYKKKKRFKNLMEEITNWIVYTSIRPVSSRIIKILPRPRSGENNQVISPSSSASVIRIKERLRILESLRKEGLINEKEYRMKRIEILKGF